MLPRENDPQGRSKGDVCQPGWIDGEEVWLAFIAVVICWVMLRSESVCRLKEIVGAIHLLHVIEEREEKSSFQVKVRRVAEKIPDKIWRAAANLEK